MPNLRAIVTKQQTYSQSVDVIIDNLTTQLIKERSDEEKSKQVKAVVKIGSLWTCISKLPLAMGIVNDIRINSIGSSQDTFCVEFLIDS